MLPSNAGSGYTKTCSLPHRCAQQQTNAFTHTQTQTILHNLPFIRSSCPVFIKCQNSLIFYGSLSHRRSGTHHSKRNIHTKRHTHAHTIRNLYFFWPTCFHEIIKTKLSLSLSITLSLSLPLSLFLCLTLFQVGACSLRKFSAQSAPLGPV